MRWSPATRLLAVLAVAFSLPGCGGSVAPPGPTIGSTGASTPPDVVPTSTPIGMPTPSPVAWPEGVVAYPVGSGGSPLPYLEYLPAGYGDGSPRPLLVFMHGVDEEADGSEASLARILGLGIPQMIANGSWPSDRPFVVLMPQEPVAKSQQCDFGTEIAAFLDFAVDRYQVDEARVYLTGISCGAIGINDYLARTQEIRIAAAVPISGHMLWALEEGGCLLARVPLWAFHGARDDIVPVEYVKQQIETLRACTDPSPSELNLTVYPDADHDAWTRTYDLSARHDIYAWMLEHARE